MLVRSDDPADRAENAGYALNAYLDVVAKGKADAAGRGEIAFKAYMETHDTDARYDDIRDLVADLLHYIHEHGEVEDMEEFVKEPVRRFSDGIRDVIAYEGDEKDHCAQSKMDVINLLTDLAVLASAEEEFDDVTRFFFTPVFNFEAEFDEDDFEDDDDFDDDEDLDDDDELDGDDEFRM